VIVEGQNAGSKVNLEVIGLSVVLLGIVGSFLVGSILGEDSIGGAYGDFRNFHWPTIERFSTMPWSTAVAKDYPVANNPLLYIIASLLPLHGDQRVYHVITFLIGLLIWPLLAWAYNRRYSNYGINWLWALFGASIILISPCFRSSAFWGTTDYLPFIFCAGTSLLLSRFQDSGTDETLRLSTLVALAAISACAFYIRQFYAFLPVIAAWTVLTRTKTPRSLVLSVFFLAALPELFLIYVWKGISSPINHFIFHPTIVNVVLVGGNIALLSTPLILGCIRRSLDDVLPEWWDARSSVLASAGLFTFILTLWPVEWPQFGGGIIGKTGLMMGAIGTPFILTISYLGLVAAALFAVRSATNAVLMGAFVLPFLMDRWAYQHYLEPSLVVAVFLFADAQIATKIFNRRVLTCYFAFNVFILAIGIAYYDSDLPLISPRIPDIKPMLGQILDKVGGPG
jgi:hypothetical protein